MKRIFLLWLCLALISMVCTVAVFAEEPELPVNETEEAAAEGGLVPDGPEENQRESENTVEEQVVETGSKEHNTLYARIFEFLEHHKDTIIMVTGFFGTAFITLQDIRRKKAVDKTLGSQQKLMLSGLEGVTVSQNGVIDAANLLSLGYEDMKKKYTEHENAEDDRYRLVSGMFIQNATMLDILTSVYVHSKNLPQGVKDLVSLKYARCLSALDDDEKMKACTVAVREIIGGKELSVPEEEAVRE